MMVPPPKTPAEVSDGDEILSTDRAEQKRELLRYLLEKEGIRTSLDKATITPREPYEPIPLSFAQERLWFLDQLEPDRTPNNILNAFRLEGWLNVTAVLEAIDEIVRRHEVFRSTLSTLDGPPVQVVAAPASRSAVPLVDLRTLPHSERASEGLRIAIDQAHRRIDLERGPWFRFCLLRVDDADHCLLLVIHQSIYDWSSVRVLCRELTRLYEGFCRHARPTLPALTLQFGDFAVWQRKWAQAEALEPHLSYWRERLEGELPALDLPTDRPRPPVQSYRGAKEVIEIPVWTAERIRSLAKEGGVTVFVTLMAAFTTMIYRYSGQDDVVVGFPILSRDHPDLENLIGFFINTLVLRTDLSSNPTFRDLLARVHHTALDAYVHQDLPFEKLVGELRLERDLSRNPLFQVMFILHNAPRPSFELPDLTVTPVEMDSGLSKFDLTVALAESNGGLSGSLEYSTDLFDVSTVRRMIGHFQVLLKGIVENPDGTVATLPLLTEPEQIQLLTEWNDTRAFYPDESCLHELFETLVGKIPDASAVVFGEQQLTYGALNARANQLARHLRGLGAGPEFRVGICVDRSLEMLIGLLGILKAGGAYVPLDPAYPEERIAFMIEDAGVSVLLTQEALKDKMSGVVTFPSPPTETGHASSVSRLGSSVDPYVLFLDTDWNTFAHESSDDLATRAASDNLANVIYTSGSTGRPKGVQVSHRALVNLLTSLRETPGLKDRDILLAVTTISFDIAALELYLPLIAGARVVVASREQATDPRELMSLLAEWTPTVMQATPSTWGLLVDQGWTGSKGLTILCGGDVLPRGLANGLLERGASLWNLFGPTETTVWSTLCEVEPGDGAVSIGRPIGNTAIYILDCNGQPAPVIVPGELYIGGEGLARGYLARPGQTAERFVPDPYGRQPGSRNYKTGDRARYRADGNIEFLSRVDDQVKIRGHRVELGEVEAALRGHAAVREAAVVAREEQPTGSQSKTGASESRGLSSQRALRNATVTREMRLVAYVVPGEPKPTTSELHNYLKNELPHYMIPSAFVHLDALPLMANGKIDRAALPRPGVGHPGLDEVFLSPRTWVEESILAIWTEALKVEEIGVRDNFFELGGHSLLAIRVISRLNDIFHIQLPLGSIFQAPTVAALAQHAETALRGDQGVQPKPIEAAPRTGALPLSLAQEHLWLMDQWLPNTPFFNIPYFLRISGPLDVAALVRSLNTILQRHESLRTFFGVVEKQPVQIVSSTSRFKLPVVDLRPMSHKEREKEALRIAEKEAKQPFDLAKAPLVRGNLLWLGDEDHVLLIVLHHIVSDAWSLGVVSRELTELYTAFARGSPIILPELPIQYADFARWQREALPDLVEAHLEYWQKKLAGPLPALQYSNAKPGAIRTFRTSWYRLELGDELLKALKLLSRKEEATLFMTLLTAFKILLHSYTAQDDIRVGTSIADRHKETEGLIGLFVNTLVLRTDLSGDPTFRELLKRVRQTTSDAYAHQDLPFQALLPSLERQPEVNRSSLFQVMFVHQNRGIRALKVPGLTVEPWDSAEWMSDPDRTPTTYDLTLVLGEEQERLAGFLIYKTDLFAAESIQQMVERFRGMVEAIVSKPGQRLFTLRELAAQDRPQNQS